MSFITLYVTHKNKKEAEKIVSHLLKKHLIACANFFPIQSQYWWKGRLEKTKEIVTLLKTRKENWKKVEKEIIKIHLYETPCIMKLDVTANNDYERWVGKETR